MVALKSIEKIVLKSYLNEEIKKLGFKFNPELVLMAFRITGPCSLYISLGAKSVCKFSPLAAIHFLLHQLQEFSVRSR